MSNDSVISVRVDGALADRLNALSAATGRPRAFYVREAIVEHLEEIEDYYLAVEVAQRVHAGTMRSYTAEEARAALGIIDADNAEDDPLGLIA